MKEDVERTRGRLEQTAEKLDGGSGLQFKGENQMPIMRDDTQSMDGDDYPSGTIHVSTTKPTDMLHDLKEKGRIVRIVVGGNYAIWYPIGKEWGVYTMLAGQEFELYRGADESIAARILEHGIAEYEA